MKGKVSILLLLSVLGGARVFALDIQAGAGVSLWEGAVTSDNTYDGEYKGAAAFVGVGKGFFANFLVVGGEYEFAYGREFTWELLGPQWNGRYLMQHSPKVYVKVRGMKFLSIAGTMGLDIALPYTAEGNRTASDTSFALGLRLQALAFYAQCDFIFPGEGVGTRIAFGAMLP